MDMPVTNSKSMEDAGLYINTFGNFEIKCNGSSMLNAKRRSYKIWELFNFMLVYRNQNLTQEKIIENLMIAEEYDDPKNVLKAQIFRLRNALREIDGGRFFKVNCHDGFYTLSISSPFTLDVDLFQKLCTEYGNIDLKLIEHKLSKYNEILSVYRGEYLSGFGFEDWVTPVRNYYHSMFLNCTHEILKLLKPLNMNEEIANICEKAVLIEPCDETINIYLLEAYICMCKYRKAEEYYGYIASKYYREIGIKPSKAIQLIYKKIKIAGNSKSLILSEKIKDTGDGPIYCNYEIFRYIYNIEKHRKSESNTLCVITVQNSDLSYIPSDILRSYMENTKKILMQKLRKGDVFTLWNETQIYILFMGCIDDAKLLFSRKVNKKLNDECAKYSLVTKVMFETL